MLSENESILEWIYPAIQFADMWETIAVKTQSLFELFDNSLNKIVQTSEELNKQLMILSRNVKLLNTQGALKTNYLIVQDSQDTKENLSANILTGDKEDKKRHDNVIMDESNANEILKTMRAFMI